MSDPLPEDQYAYGLDAEVARLASELEQARKVAWTCPHSNCDARRYRNALERIEKLPFLTAQGAKEIAHAALAGDK